MARLEKQRKKEKDEFGWGKDPSEVTEEEQQKCVSASATVGALIRYICRCDEHNAQSKEWRAQQYGYGQIGPLTKQQQEACVAASATVARCYRTSAGAMSVDRGT